VIDPSLHYWIDGLGNVGERTTADTQYAPASHLPVHTFHSFLAHGGQPTGEPLFSDTMLCASRHERIAQRIELYVFGRGSLSVTVLTIDYLGLFGMEFQSTFLHSGFQSLLYCHRLLFA